MNVKERVLSCKLLRQAEAHRALLEKLTTQCSLRHRSELPLDTAQEKERSLNPYGT